MNWSEKYCKNKDGFLDCIDFLGETISKEAHTEALTAINSLILASSLPGRFRPQPARGSVPTNPMILTAKGEAA